jgi:hypothetical protein
MAYDPPDDGNPLEVQIMVMSDQIVKLRQALEAEQRKTERAVAVKEATSKLLAKVIADWVADARESGRCGGCSG